MRQDQCQRRMWAVFISAGHDSAAGWKMKGVTVPSVPVCLCAGSNLDLGSGSEPVVWVCWSGARHGTARLHGQVGGRDVWRGRGTSDIRHQTSDRRQEGEGKQHTYVYGRPSPGFKSSESVLVCPGGGSLLLPDEWALGTGHWALGAAAGVASLFRVHVFFAHLCGQRL